MKFRTLYPTGTSRAAGQLVRGRATIHYEEFGRADGVPALFLHGGPGAGCFPRHASFFDPSHYRVLLLDQRGCGRSTPRGDLDQDTATLVADLEALREHLSLPAWGVVLGGSWGTTLALAYAQAHPQRVRALVLRAVCLMREREIRWLFAAGGMADLAPTAWSRFAAHGDDGGGDRGPDGVLRRYAEALAGADGPARNSAASAWMSWEGAVGGTGARLPACPPPRDADAAGAADAPAGSSWEWRPLERRWAHGAAALSTAGVRTALTDGWRPRIRAAVGQVVGRAQRAEAARGADERDVVVGAVAAAAHVLLLVAPRLPRRRPAAEGLPAAAPHPVRRRAGRQRLDLPAEHGARAPRRVARDAPPRRAWRGALDVRPGAHARGGRGDRRAEGLAAGER